MGEVVDICNKVFVGSPDHIFRLSWHQSRIQDCRNLAAIDSFLTYRCVSYAEAFVVLRHMVRILFPDRIKEVRSIFVQHYCTLRGVKPKKFRLDIYTTLEREVL